MRAPQAVPRRRGEGRAARGERLAHAPPVLFKARTAAPRRAAAGRLRVQPRSGGAQSLLRQRRREDGNLSHTLVTVPSPSLSSSAIIASNFSLLKAMAPRAPAQPLRDDAQRAQDGAAGLRCVERPSRVMWRELFPKCGYAHHGARATSIGIRTRRATSPTSTCRLRSDKRVRPSSTERAERASNNGKRMNGVPFGVCADPCTAKAFRLLLFVGRGDFLDK